MGTCLDWALNRTCRLINKNNNSNNNKKGQASTFLKNCLKKVPQIPFFSNKRSVLTGCLNGPPVVLNPTCPFARHLSTKTGRVFGLGA